jgi:hypothetical protein
MDWTTCLFQGVATPTCIPIVFANLLNFLFMAVGTVAFLVLLLGGVKLILANGDAKQLDGARKALVFGVIGLLLVLCSYIIVNLLATITGVNCILVFGPFTHSISINGHTYTNCFSH